MKEISFQKFAKFWIGLYVPSSMLYGTTVSESLTDMLKVLESKHHSGTSESITLLTLRKLLNEYLDE